MNETDFMNINPTQHVTDRGRGKCFGSPASQAVVNIFSLA